jgi:hypothetical protein
MPTYQTLLDIMKFNGADKTVGLVDETVRAHPEIFASAARTIVGTRLKTVVRTGLGNVGGSFRAANQGTSPIVHTLEQRFFETYMLTPRVEADVTVADSYEDGKASYFAMQASGVMEGEWQGMCRQFYYGALSGFANAAGNPGLIDMYDSANMVVDAGGTTNNVASSVWFVKFGESACEWIWGNNQAGIQMGPIRIEGRIDPANSSKILDRYVQVGTGYPGLMLTDLRAVGRIKKVTTDVGCGLTDTLLEKMMSQFQVGVRPDVIFLTRRSAQQLQQSRITALVPNPNWPTGMMWTDGVTVPFALTDSILNTESLTL